MTSCINGWFFIVLRAFIILIIKRSPHRPCGKKDTGIPDDGRLNHVFPILVDRLEHLGRLCLDFSLDRLVKVHSNLL